MTKTRLLTVLAAIFLTASNMAYADPLKGTACFTKWWFKGNASDAWQSVITCPDPIGDVSVEQLYAKGWRVISVSRMNDRGNYYAVVIEEQRK